MTVTCIASELRVRAIVDFNTSPIGQALSRWKARMEFAVHGNYTFSLPAREVLRRWDDAKAAEADLTELIAPATTKTHWVHTIEAAIARVEKECELVRQGHSHLNESDVDDIKARLSKAWALLEEVRR